MEQFLPDSISVAIYADDHAQCSLAQLLPEPEFRTVIVDDESCRFLWKCSQLQPLAAIVILEMGKNHEAGFIVVSKLREASLAPTRIVIGTTESVNIGVKAFEHGAANYITYEQAILPGVLAQSIRDLLHIADECQPSSLVAPAPILHTKLAPANVSDNPLTAREVEVLTLMAQYSNRQAVATTLYISSKTVGSHLENIYNKLHLTADMRRHYHATRIAIQKGWITPLDDDASASMIALPPKSPGPLDHTPATTDKSSTSFAQAKLKKSTS